MDVKMLQRFKYNYLNFGITFNSENFQASLQSSVEDIL